MREVAPRGNRRSKAFAFDPLRVSFSYIEREIMARYTGPKARINRRLGSVIFESAGAVKAFDRKPQPPGMSTARRKISTYGLAMQEKQKLKYYYGLSERQLRKMFAAASRAKGNTGGELLVLCERRLDNVVRMVGFTKTRPQARQGVSHGHFLLSGRKIDVPSAYVKPGDTIHVKRKSNLTVLYRGTHSEAETMVPDWLSVDIENLSATVLRLPTASDSTLPVEIGMVIELLSR